VITKPGTMLPENAVPGAVSETRREMKKEHVGPLVVRVHSIVESRSQSA
jgi:hypothetical protein